jgi:hypothetical protein
MCDETNLPDDDFASIYGHAALHARTLARLDALLRKLEAQAADLQAWRTQRDATHRTEPPEEA